MESFLHDKMDLLKSRFEMLRKARHFKMFDEPIKMKLEEFMKNGLKKETGHVVVLGYKNGRAEIDPSYLPRGFLMDPLGRKCILRIFVGWSFADAFAAYEQDANGREMDMCLNKIENEIRVWKEIYG
jgi:hypothetical protein